MKRLALKLLNINFLYFIFLIFASIYFYFFSENGRRKRLFYAKELSRIQTKHECLHKKRLYLERELFKIKNLPKISEYNARDRYDLISKKEKEIYFYIK